MIVARTDRLLLRRMSEDDAPFILELLNDADFIRFIADRGVRSIADAQAYLRDGPLASYARHGFGLYLVARRDDGAAIGMCGLLRRDYLDDVDIGYALLPAARRAGYALEAVNAVVDHARRDLALGRLLAIISPDNVSSHAVARRAGMHEHGSLVTPDGDEVVVFEMLLA